MTSTAMQSARVSAGEGRPVDRPVGPLAGIRVCDFSGQLAGAGATKFMAAFGADVIRVEDPVREGRWDILRGARPYVDDRRGVDLGGAFNNHNVGKRGITLNLRTEAGLRLAEDLIRMSDVVTENFSAGVLARIGLSYERLRELRHDVIYVSNSGFGHSGPYQRFKSWGPIVQAVSGLTAATRLPRLPPAGIGFSHMDHQGANFMILAVLAALRHRAETGEGQWIDLACAEAALSLLGPEVLEAAVTRSAVKPDDRHTNHSGAPVMVPHNIYPAAGEDSWIAIACRDDEDWRRFTDVIDQDWARDGELATVAGRVRAEAELDDRIALWTAGSEAEQLESVLAASAIPAAWVRPPAARIDGDAETSKWGLWPTVEHSEMGRIRVDGIPVHLSKTDWSITRGAPCLGEHNDEVIGGLLGRDAEALQTLRRDGVI